MRILLTGGAGFIGSHLAQRLLEREETLIMVDNFNDFYDPKIKLRNVERIKQKGEFKLYQEDLLNQRALQEIFQRHEPEAIIHLAAYAGVRPSLQNPALYSKVNVTGTTHLLELAKEYGVGNFIFGSSSSVYGINNKVPFCENDPIERPISPYAATKRAGELLCFVYHQNCGIPITCLRLFTVYGPHQRPEMAIHKFTRRIDRGEEIEVYHHGKSQRDYTYIEDILQGILCAFDKPAGFEIFNLGNCRTTVLLDLIKLIEEALKKKARVRLMPAQPGDVPITCADISWAKEKLGYSPATPIEEGVPRFVEWYLRNADS
ncbi:GDP-mannose 4,6-dehydratase [Acidobacteria bacterium AH-259-G07]|nr:GDP-mannose 4,6-dehydratase [Acidobacteria bacterium AH-259-G07]